MYSHKILKTLAVITTIGMVLVILAGAIVTKTESGDGCGQNWPLCHGQLIPDELTLETLIEYTHRLITGLIGLLVFVFSIWTALKYRKVKEVVWMAVASIFFLLWQSGLGALAVVFGQSDLVMALHFGFSLLSFAAVYILMTYVFHLANTTQPTSRATKLPVTTTSRGFRIATVGLWVYTYAVVYLGALVRHTGSMLGCEGWPLCNGKLIPEFTNDQVMIQYIHRMAALMFIILTLIYGYYALRKYSQDRKLYVHMLLILTFAIIQIITGGWVVLSGMNTVAALTHALVITLLFGFLSYVLLYVLRKNNATAPVQATANEEEIQK